MKLSVLFCFLTCSLAVMAQYDVPKKEYCDELKNRTLAIELLEGNSETVTNLNKTLKEVFTDEWKWSGIEFLSKSEIDNILDSKNTNYFVLRQSSTAKEDIRRGYIDKYGRRSNVGIGSSYSYVAFSFAYYDFNLLMPTNKKPIKVMDVGLANGDLARIDFLYVAQQLNRHIKASIDEVGMKEFYNIERNIEACKNKKIIILQDFIKGKERAKIGNYYKGEYELVDYNAYQDVILKQTPGNAYVKIIWSNQHKLYVWVVADAETGETLSLLSFGGVKFGHNHKANDIIKVKHFQYIDFKKGQKFNDKYN